MKPWVLVCVLLASPGLADAQASRESRPRGSDWRLFEALQDSAAQQALWQQQQGVLRDQERRREFREFERDLREERRARQLRDVIEDLAR